MPPERVLAAADALFADLADPHAVTMDAIAAAAGVGKGTLFRAFGSREGLLDTLWAGKLAALRESVDAGDGPLGAGAPAGERVVAFLDALLMFKLANRHLIRARERAKAGVRQTPNYLWMHGLVRDLVRDGAPGAAGGDAEYAAHALLAALDIDLVEEMLAAGRSTEDVRRAQAALVRAVLGV